MPLLLELSIVELLQEGFPGMMMMEPSSHVSAGAPLATGRRENG